MVILFKINKIQLKCIAAFNCIVDNYIIMLTHVDNYIVICTADIKTQSSSNNSNLGFQRQHNLRKYFSKTGCFSNRKVKPFNQQLVIIVDIIFSPNTSYQFIQREVVASAVIHVLCRQRGVAFCCETLGSDSRN